MPRTPASSDSVTPALFAKQSPASPVQPSVRLESESASPLSWLLGPKDRENLTDRVLARLIQAELHEVDPHRRDDYRVSWLTLRLLQTGECRECTPLVAATYQILKAHPDEVWPRILADRRAKLGKEYSDWYDAAGNRKPDAPKKDAASVPHPTKSEAA